MKPDRSLGPINEQNLWKSFQAGDQESYTTLYHLHIRAMHRYAASLVPTSEAFVLDCIHDVFTEIWEKRARLSVPDNVRFYLLKALKTRIMHLLERKERPFKSLSDLDLAAVDSDSIEMLEELDSTVSQQERLRLLIAQLPFRQQQALKLRFVENLNYNQIGQMLNMNAQSARNLVFRAIEKLRGWILFFFFIFLN